VPVPSPSPSPPSLKERVKEVLRPRRLPAWLALEEEEAPDPPVVRAEAGIIGWPYVKTAIQVGRRRGGDPGMEISDVERDMGLPRSGVSPFFEASFGQEVRVGGSFLDLDREGRLRQANTTIDAGGRVLAEPGDLVSARVRYTQAEGYVLWDVLYGARYRIGPLGGVRFTRIASELRGIKSAGSRAALVQHVNSIDDVASPFFGGHIELDPVELFTVYADVRVVDWAWEAVGLRDQRTFSSRLGVSLSLFEGLVGMALDFRFLSSTLDSGNSNSHSRTHYTIDAAGVGFTGTFRY
jgi:hypothetical protein